mmetsp:Transcript_9891/g.23305  ORF Transcript_9891/g.23305 Transcript_9891/m.23305 type:complete len:584 (+) Transcript_9891:47-1798(+)
MMLRKLFAVIGAALLQACQSSEEFPAFDTAVLSDLALGYGHYLTVPGARCSDNSTFYVGLYLVDKGDGTPVTENLTIEFAGGGACFDPASCAVGDADGGVEAGPGFIRNLAFVPDFAALDRSCGITGFGMDNYCNVANPLRHHSMIYVPYCTGDLHGGTQVFTYRKDTDGSFDINHVGANNSVRILDWAASLFPNPKHIIVFGGSAGALGTLLWAPHIADRWPGADIRAFADSGLHVPAGAEVTSAFFNREYGAKVWRLNNELTALNELSFDENYTDWIVGILEKYGGRLVLGLFSCDLDYAADDWWEYISGLYGTPSTDRLAFVWSMLEHLNATAPPGTLHSYILPGDCHHVGLEDFVNLYAEPGKPSLVSWLSDLFFADHSTASNIWCERSGGSACSWRDFPTEEDAFDASVGVLQAGIFSCQKDCCWLTQQNVAGFAPVFFGGLAVAKGSPALATFCSNCTSAETCPIAQCIAGGAGCASLRNPVGLKFFELVCKEVSGVNVASTFAAAAAVDGCCPTACEKSPSEQCPQGVHDSCVVTTQGETEPETEPAGTDSDSSLRLFTPLVAGGCVIGSIFLGSL